MTTLPPPEQWVICKMNEMELAEEIEKHIDYIDENGRSVHLPVQFVRHCLKRDDGALETIVAIATLPIILADGGVLAMEDDFDSERGIGFKIPKQVMVVLPARADCTPKAVKRAMRFLCEDWLTDVEADYAGKCTAIAAALTIIERSLLPDRPTFFVTAGRRGGGKTTLLTMLIMAVTGIRPAASAWSSNEEERRKALLAQFMYGVPYILWDNIPRGIQISCPHIERSCTAAFYADRKLGVSEMVRTAASTIHLFTGNNINPRGDLASRSLHIRINVDRPDPENREFKHPDPIGWTENHRAEILGALYTILLGNLTLDERRDAPMKTRFKMWWRLIGSAVEHAAKLHEGDKATDVDFEKLFLTLEETEDEDSVDLADALSAIAEQWPKGCYANDLAEAVNNHYSFGQVGITLRDFLYPAALPTMHAGARSVGKQLRKHIDDPVKSGERTLVLRRKADAGGATKGIMEYFVEIKR
jgi:hypothetical protein